MNGNASPPLAAGAGGHVVAASLAAVLSVVVHLLLVVAASRVDLRFLARTAYMPPERRYMELQLGSVEISPEIQARVMTTLRELGQAAPPDVTQAVDEMRVAPEVGVTEPPVVMAVELEPELAAVPAPTLQPPGEQWIPRQEILAVESVAVGDVPVGLERRLIPSIERVPLAPDIALAVSSSRIRDTVPDALPAPAPAELLSERVGTPAPAQDLDRPVVAVVPGPGRELFEEQPDEVTDIEPVERVLTASVVTFGDRRDRHYAYFKLTLERDGQQMLPVRPKDVALVVDAGIAETRMVLGREALQRALSYVSPADRFAVVSAGRGAVSVFQPGWVPGGPAMRRDAEHFIQSITTASDGRGDISAGLDAVFAMDRQPGRPVIALVLTDGQGVPQAAQVRAYRGPLSVFIIGHLAQSNYRLLELVSTWPGLKAEIVNTGRFDLLGQVEDMMRGVQRPVLSDISFRFASDVEIEVYPQLVGNLYLDRPLTIHGRYRRGAERLVMQALGMAGTTRADMIFDLPMEDPRDTRGGGDGAIRDEFGRQKIYHLVSEYARTRNPAFLRSLRTTAREYSLPIPYQDTIGL